MYTLPSLWLHLVSAITKLLHASAHALAAHKRTRCLAMPAVLTSICTWPNLQVRRKADPAKEALQVFVKRWRDDPKVQQHPSHDNIKGKMS